MSEVIVITSGKGGVGKTTTSANIGCGLALAGKKGSNGCSSIFNKDFIKSLMIILLALVLF